jgi:hypothetical protein
MLYGLSWIAYAMGAAIGPVIVGRAFDRAGYYQSSFIKQLSLPCRAGVIAHSLPAAIRPTASR